MRSYATRQIVIGLVIAGVGLLISLASYQAASESESGGGVCGPLGSRGVRIVQSSSWGAHVCGGGPRSLQLELARSPAAPIDMPPPPATMSTSPAMDDNLGARIRLGQTRIDGDSSPSSPAD